MNKKDFIRCVSESLRMNNTRKPIHMPKQIFHITDDEGNSKKFTIKKTDKEILYTKDDVENIVEACLHVIQESLKQGEPITFHGFGTLGLNYRKSRKTKLVGTNKEIIIKGRYLPKFTFGNNLRMCAKMYELSLEDNPEESKVRCDE